MTLATSSNLVTRLVTSDERVIAQIYRATHALKGGDIVPIKWNALKVSEAADVVEKFLDQAAEPLEQARVATVEALKIENLPQYIEQKINSILADIERITGGEVTRTNYDCKTAACSKSVEHVEGSIKQAIQRLRDDIPSKAVEADEIREKYGSTQSLI